MFAAYQSHGLLDFVTACISKRLNISRTQNRRRFCVHQFNYARRASGNSLERTFQHGLKIHFGHRTFRGSEARGKAHVHVVIIGFANFDTANKLITITNRKSHGVSAKNISPYLVEVVISCHKKFQAAFATCRKSYSEVCQTTAEIFCLTTKKKRSCWQKIRCLQNSSGHFSVGRIHQWNIALVFMAGGFVTARLRACLKC